MTNYPINRELLNDLDILDYYLDAIVYRNTHKDVSREVALDVFNTTHPITQLSFAPNKEVSDLRFSFSALEAPGAPDDYEQDYDEYEDELWKHLYDLIIKLKER